MGSGPSKRVPSIFNMSNNRGRGHPSAGIDPERGKCVVSGVSSLQPARLEGTRLRKGCGVLGTSTACPDQPAQHYNTARVPPTHILVTTPPVQLTPSHGRVLSQGSVPSVQLVNTPAPFLNVALKARRISASVLFTVSQLCNDVMGNICLAEATSLES